MHKLHTKPKLVKPEKKKASIDEAIIEWGIQFKRMPQMSKFNWLNLFIIE